MVQLALTRKSRTLTIRPLKADDYDAWKTALSGMLKSKNTWDQSPKDLSDLTKSKYGEVLRSQNRYRREDRNYDLGIFLNTTGELIGFVAVMSPVRGITQSAFLGYRIFNRHWGNGFGKEAARMAIDIAFRDLKLHRIEAGIEPRNRRSILLARSLGLRKEGLKRRVIFMRGEWRDLTMYSATCEEFGIKWKGEALPRL